MVGGPHVRRFTIAASASSTKSARLLNPRVAVLLIGERPGLATAESLSAYMAYQPRASHTDANRNLISNIHARGLSPTAAATRILNLAAQMFASRLSGYTLRESPPSTLPTSASG